MSEIPLTGHGLIFEIKDDPRLQRKVAWIGINPPGELFILPSRLEGFAKKYLGKETLLTFTAELDRDRYDRDHLTKRLTELREVQK